MKCLRVLREVLPVVMVGVVLVTVLAMAPRASAQGFSLFDLFQPKPERPERSERSAPRGSGGGGFFGGDDSFFGPAPRRAPREDASRAPPPEKRDQRAIERNVMVIGDAMADWLAYGLEDAYSEQPDMGVLRRTKLGSGLIRYQARGEPSDWTGAARGFLAQDNPAAIVIMLGYHDRTSIRVDRPGDKRAGSKAGDTKPDDARSVDAKPGESKVDQDKTASRNDESSDGDDADLAELPAIIAPERGARQAGGNLEFRDERWSEVYGRKIDELIAAAKSKNVPVIWVGLPSVKGTRATADMLYLNGLYRAAAQKANITYVDIWDGFVDESGRFIQQGPDFEGQIRRLRAYDGVWFTKPGARKVAHYVDREIARLLSSRATPVAWPTEHAATPEIDPRPGLRAPRPMAGPVLPLVAPIVASDQLLGGVAPRPLAGESLASRTLVRGEPLNAPAGRADDASWPRREVGRELARGDGTVAAPSLTGDIPVAVTPVDKPPERKRRAPSNVQVAPASSPFNGPSIFGFPARERPRPPAAVGPSASVPSLFR